MPSHDMRRRTALMLRESYNTLHKRLRRKPDALELSIDVLTWVSKVEEAKEISVRHPQSWQHGADRSALGRLVPANDGRPQYYSADFTNAEAARLVFQRLGDSNTPRSNNDLDRKILDRLVHQMIATGRTNASALAQEFGTTHTTVRNRALARCSRIIGRLMNDFPDLLDVTARLRRRRASPKP